MSENGYEAKLARREPWSAVPLKADIPENDVRYVRWSGLVLGPAFSSPRDPKANYGDRRFAAGQIPAMVLTTNWNGPWGQAKPPLRPSRHSGLVPL